MAPAEFHIINLESGNYYTGTPGGKAPKYSFLVERAKPFSGYFVARIVVLLTALTGQKHKKKRIL